MTISAQIIADSISPQGIRLTSIEVVCHRFILPEVNTHRTFSRNWASSRAIPTVKLLEMVRNAPATPLHWGKNRPGMQATDELAGIELQAAQDQWRVAADHAARSAEIMLKMGLHKQVANRVLEPFLFVRGIISSTDWSNFFALRRHPDAQPEIKALADAMWDAMATSEPQYLSQGAWHLPYVEEAECIELWKRPFDRKSFDHPAIPVSVARCARVSYLTHDGRKTTIEEDLALYERLVGAAPIHASPAEHQATPDVFGSREGKHHTLWRNPDKHGNFNGWVQHRKLLPNENITTYPSENPA